MLKKRPASGVPDGAVAPVEKKAKSEAILQQQVQQLAPLQALQVLASTAATPSTVKVCWFFASM
jgi:hypothetical protein